MKIQRYQKDQKDRFEFDEVLSALGQMQPPAGMEDRILRRLAERPPAAASARGWWWAGGLALAGAMALLCLLALRTARPGPRPLTTTAHAVRPKAILPAPPAMPPLARVRPQEHFAAKAHRVEQLKSVEHAASFPAPPMPLTEQERVLMQVARGKDLPKFAEFNPENRDELIAQSKAEFDQFFPQPKSQEIQDEAHAHNR